MTPDTINSLFELGGGVVVWINVRKLILDRKVRGVFWPFAGFFAAFSLWSLFFYISLGQWLSFMGGLIIAAGNITWFTLALKWRNN
jgi:hypothetical protein